MSLVSTTAAKKCKAQSRLTTCLEIKPGYANPSSLISEPTADKPGASADHSEHSLVSDYMVEVWTLL